MAEPNSHRGAPSTPPPRQAPKWPTTISSPEIESMVSVALLDPGTLTREDQERTSITQDKMPTPWKPYTLHRRTLYASTVCFIGMALGLEGIFIISETRQGLFTSTSSNMQFAWTYGPAVVVTAISSLWSCVDFSAKTATPWLRNIRKKEGLRESLSLDYVSPFCLKVPFQALRNKDMLVAATSTISLLLCILLILSSSLLRFRIIDIVTPITLLTEFDNNPSSLASSNIWPLYEMLGLTRYQMRYPLGIRDEFTFQSFSPPPSSASKLETTVEALHFELHCDQGQLSASNDYNVLTTEEVDLSIDITWPKCDPTSRVLPSLFYLSNVGPNPPPVQRIWASEIFSDSCRGTSLVSNDVAVWVVAEVLMEQNNSSLPVVTVTKSQALLCKPFYTMVDLDIVQDGEGPYRVSVASSSNNRTLGDLRAWNITQAILDSYLVTDIKRNSGVFSAVDKMTEGNANFLATGRNDIYFDDLSTAMLSFDPSSYPSPQSIFHYPSLHRSIQDYMQLHASLLIGNSIMRPTSRPGTGFATIPETRLVVQTVACQVMVAIFLVSAGILLFAVQSTLPANPLAFRGDPRTLEGILLLTQGINRQSCNGLEPARSSTLGVLRRQGNVEHCQDQEIKQYDTGAKTRLPLDGSPLVYSDLTESERMNQNHVRVSTTQYPLILRYQSRLLFCVLTFGILMLLEGLLRKSNHDNGIGTSLPDKYTSYLWTLLPALILSLVGMFSSAVDFELRRLAPFHALVQGPASYARSVSLNLCGILPPQVIARQLRARHYGTAMATVATMFASLLTITSASLFLEKAIPPTSTQRVRLVGSFSEAIYGEQDADRYSFRSSPYNTRGRHGSDPLGVVSSLVLQSNLSYPNNTFEDLALPVIALDWVDEVPGLVSLNTSLLKIEAVIPALRGPLACKFVDPSTISSDILLNATALEESWLRVNITGCVSIPSRLDRSLVHGAIGTTGLMFNPSLPLDSTIGENPDSDPATMSSNVFGWTDSLTCTDEAWEYFYVWGSYYLEPLADEIGNVTSFNSAVSVSGALKCNGSIEAVDVETTISSIAGQDRPRPLDGTSQWAIEPYNHTQDLSGLYKDLFSPGGDRDDQQKTKTLDNFFRILTSKQNKHGLKGDDDAYGKLANSSFNTEVALAIQSQHGIIAAQALSNLIRTPDPNATTEAENRKTLPGFGVFDRLGKGRVNSTTYPATVSDLGHRERVLQNEKTTRIVQALLAGTLVFSMFSWAFSLFPRIEQGRLLSSWSPTGPASVITLMADGNLFTERFGPQNKTLSEMSYKELKDTFGDDKPVFWMGWGRSGSDFPRRKGEDNIGYESLDNDKVGATPRRFGIWVIPLGMVPGGN